ncbi:hypothetical protein VPHD81_0064 [Vibrio phage D81]
MTRQTFPDNLIFANAAPELDQPNATVYSSAYQSGAGKTPPKAGVHNAVFKRSDLQHQHVERNGICKYDARTLYDINGLTLAPDGGIYQSKTQGNTNNDPASTPAQWDFVISAQKTKNIDNAIAVNNQLTKDNQGAISRNKSAIDKNTVNITRINDRLDLLFIEYMTALFPIRSAIMRSIDPGLPVSRGGLGFGTWQNKAGRVPVGAGSHTDSQGSTRTFRDNGTGGEYTHTLTVHEMPSHQHTSPWGEAYTGARWGENRRYGKNNRGSGDSDGDNYLYYNEPVGGNGAHNNIQPWFGVKIWYRVA